MAQEHSKVAYQVMWNRLISVVEEQAQALVRTAFSTSVREAGDLSAGVYDIHGNMLAQAVTCTPGHVNAMADAVAHFIRRIGRQNILEGDVYITNDPWEGTGHLHDITMVTPSFHNGMLVGFFACTAHIVDTDGRGFGAYAQSVYEEGSYIPIMKFADKGEVDETLVRIIRGNVREPDQLIGDIYALATCLRFVAAVSASCSGDKADKEESAGGFRCYGDYGLRLQRWTSRVSDCVMIGCAIQLTFPT